MRELISPEQSERLVLLASVALVIGGAVWGRRVLGGRGLVVGLLGVLVWVAWQGHKYLTRYDPHIGYFGLEKVSVLLGEAVAFVLVGAALGYCWRKATATAAREDR